MSKIAANFTCLCCSTNHSTISIRSCRHRRLWPEHCGRLGNWVGRVNNRCQSKSSGPPNHRKYGPYQIRMPFPPGTRRIPCANIGATLQNGSLQIDASCRSNRERPAMKPIFVSSERNIWEIECKKNEDAKIRLA